MLQQDKPEDFVIATGEAHSAREFVEEAFKCIGKTIIWEGKGLEEVGKESDSGIIRVKVNQKFFRPTEVVSFHLLHPIYSFPSFFFIQCDLPIYIPLSRISFWGIPRKLRSHSVGSQGLSFW